MALTKRDWLFAAILASVLGILLFSAAGRKKPRPVPVDDRHRTLLERLAKGADRQSVERACATCHGAGSMPFPAKHPPKEQCLLCHHWQG